MTDQSDTTDYPPLLAAWLDYRRIVLGKTGEDCLDLDMANFMAGAGTVIWLITVAHEEGPEQINGIFDTISNELNAFHYVIEEQLRKSRH